MPTPGGLPTKQEFIDAQVDVQHLGEITNGLDPSYVSRLGTEHKSLTGLQEEYEQKIGELGFVSIGPYSVGLVYNEYDEYSVYLGVNYKVNVGTPLPYTTTQADPTTDPNLQILPLGDMQKSVYDTNNNGKVDVAELADVATEAGEVTGVSTAPASQYYGTDAGGSPGFHDLPSAAVLEVNPVNNDWNGYLDPAHTSSLPGEDTSAGSRQFGADVELAPNLYSSAVLNDFVFAVDGWTFTEGLYKLYTFTVEQLALIDVTKVPVYIKGQDGSEYFVKHDGVDVVVTKPDTTTLKVQINDSIRTTLGITKVWRFFVTVTEGLVPEISPREVFKRVGPTFIVVDINGGSVVATSETFTIPLSSLVPFWEVGDECEIRAQILSGGDFIDTGWVLGSGSTTYGTRALKSGENLFLRTGTGAVEDSRFTGTPVGTGINSAVLQAVIKI